MNDNFVTIEIARELKELGFNKPCLVGIKDNEDYTAIGFSFMNHPNNVHDFVVPLWQQAIEYFREKHNIYININRDWHKGEFLGWFGHIECEEGCEELRNEKTYEKARNKVILRAIELSKKLKKI